MSHSFRKTPVMIATDFAIVDVKLHHTIGLLLLMRKVTGPKSVRVTFESNHCSCTCMLASEPCLDRIFIVEFLPIIDAFAIILAPASLHRIKQTFDFRSL